MWSPTHSQVLVKRCRGLNVKGKQGTNDAFVTIGLGKEKFQTSVKERSGDPVEWNEQCELAIPSQGNTAEICLTVLHRNFLGVDEFLGQVALPLNQLDVYERPRSRWLALRCKPGKTKTDYRGEIEVKVGFVVRAAPQQQQQAGSALELTNKTRGSRGSLNRMAGSISGSLLSIGKKEKANIRKLVKSVGHKVEKGGGGSGKSETVITRNAPRAGGLTALPENEVGSGNQEAGGAGAGNEDPGVNSDEEEEQEFSLASQPGSTATLDTEPPSLLPGQPGNII